MTLPPPMTAAMTKDAPSTVNGESAPEPSADSSAADEPPSRLEFQSISPSRSAGVHTFVVDVVCDDEEWAAFPCGHSAANVERLVTFAADAVGAADLKDTRDAEAVVLLSNDAEVAVLNTRFRGKAQATNVLSFPSGPVVGRQSRGRRALGDIIIARETVLREAQEREIAPAHHLQHLVVHGLLHLLGYDHLDDDEAEIMEGLETSILQTLGVPDPYGSRGGAEET